MAWPRISRLGWQNRFELFACSDAQLRLDQVDAGDGFGDWVLNLDARIHLNEVELAVGVHEELNRTCVLVADFCEAAAERIANLLAHLRRHLERRRLFNQLLMAALNGALALEEGNHFAVLVGQDLELNVARLLNELLHVELAVAEGVCCFS